MIKGRMMQYKGKVYHIGFFSDFKEFMDAEVYETLKLMIDDYDEGIDRNINKLEEDVYNLEHERDKLKDRVAELEDELSSATDKHYDDIMQYEKQINKLENRIEELEEYNEELSEELDFRDKH